MEGKGTERSEGDWKGKGDIEREVDGDWESEGKENKGKIGLRGIWDAGKR